MIPRKKLAFYALCVLLAFAHRGGAASMAWGEPVNGLQLGISCATATTVSTAPPKFEISLKNVSNHALSVPAPTAFMEKHDAHLTGYHVQPLSPLVQQLKGIQAIEMTTGGQDRKTVTQDLLVIEPGASRVLQDVPLETQAYPYYQNKDAGVTRKIWWLQPESDYAIRFAFENEQATVNGQQVWCGKALSGPVALQVTAPILTAFNITGTFTLPKTEYFVGEPIYATFRVTNNGKRTVTFMTGCDYRGSGRHDRFSFKAVDDKGVPVPDPVQPNGMGGGLGSNYDLSPGATYEETLLVNQWCAFTTPGHYTLTGARALNLWYGGGFPRMPESLLPQLAVTTDLNFTLYQDATALQKRVQALAATLSLKQDEAARAEMDALAQSRNVAALPAIETLTHDDSLYNSAALKWLGYYDLATVAPLVRKIAQGTYPNLRSQALQILAGWKDLKLEPLLCKALVSADDQERIDAVSLCYHDRYPDCLPILLKMGNDPNSYVRQYLGVALSKSGDQSAVPVLLKLLHDPSHNRFVNIWAADGLNQLGHKDGIPVLIDLLRNDDTKNYRGNVIGMLTQLTGLSLHEDYAEWHSWWEREGKLKYSKL